MVVNSIDTLEAFAATRAILDRRPIRVLHLSDTHFVCGLTAKMPRRLSAMLGLGPHGKDIWDAVINACKIEHQKAKFDLLVVSGDLTAFGTRHEFKFARRRIEDLATMLGIDPARVVVVPGNHDRFLGYVGYWFRWALKSFEHYFSDLSGNRTVSIDGTEIAIVSLDSTEEGFRVWPVFANTGRLKAKHFNAMNTFLDGSKQQTCIVVVHHHPLPVPHTALDGMTGMKNGGMVMSHVHQRKVALLLHGHKHKAYACRVSYGAHEEDTVVVAAGTACQDKLEPAPSFCIVELHPRQQVNVRMFEYTESGFDVDKNASRVFRLFAGV
jgi:3',5'-cyclic AMP phosphodiesterase CpdA